jgi:xylulokinase
VWRQTARFTTASSYLVYRLTGEHVIDRHTASHSMPLYDLAVHAWSDRFADGLVDLDRLPRLGWSDEQAGSVTRAAAALTGLRAGTPVAVGAVDALSEAISVGVVAPGDLMIMYGSTTFFILVLDQPYPNRVTWTTAGAYAGQHVLAAGMATSGSLTRWFRDELARDLPPEAAYAQLFADAAAVEPGAGGLVMLPYFSGERTPIDDPRARGVIAGLDLRHRREHLFRAVLEGVAYGVRHNLESFEAIGAPIRRVVAVGGGAQGDTWLRIVSDATGRTQEVPQQTIGASYGDAFLAGLVSGQVERHDLASWVGKPRTIAAELATRAQYDATYAQYLELYRATKPIVHALGGA